jgi:hypothetical protein
MATITDRLKRVTDKFFKFPITYQQAQENLGRWGKSESTMGYVEFEVLGLVVFDTTNSNSQVTITQQGKYDYGEVSIYFHVQDLLAVGLINNNGIILMNPNKDYLKYKGERFELLSAIEVGPDRDRANSVLVQCMVRKVLN